jgi:NADH-quinone oxidoreductase subunit A
MLALMAVVDPRAALLLHVLVAAGFVVAILALSAVLREPSTPGFGTYESGAPPHGAMTRPQAAPYFLVAVAFMIFDMEVAILFAWAVAAREAGIEGLIAATVFVVVLLAALAYLWLDGALETGPRRTPHMPRGRP